METTKDKQKNRRKKPANSHPLAVSPYFSIFARRMEVIEDKTKVSIAYVLKETSGRILEEVPASHPFVYIHGYNNIIPGLESALLNRKLGEKFSVEIPCNLGYGAYREDLLLQVPKAELQDVGELWLGMELEMFQDNDIREFQLPDTADEFIDDLNLDGDDEDEDGDGIYIIKEIYKDTVLVDGNHPFAGKDLIFDIEVIAIDEPSFTELESGFPDQAEGFDDGENFNDNYDGRYDGDFDQNENRRWR